jgi:DNA-binding MarR family transcriptional regulator
MAEIDRLNSELDRRATVEELLDQFGDRINEHDRAAAEERAAILDKLDDLER